MNNFHYAQVLLKMLYDIEIEEDLFEELGLIAYEAIGNKNIRMYKCSAKLDSENSLELPCNVLEIEAVTSSYEDYNLSTNHSIGEDYNSLIIENDIESYKRYNSQFYIPGKLLKYQKVGDRLYFDKNYGVINILYKGTMLDDDGLPEISDKEATAIATYVAYVEKYKEGLKTNNPQIIQLSVTLQNRWNQLCDLARVQYLNQNDFNQILDAKNNWHRHVFGKSTKPYL